MVRCSLPILYLLLPCKLSRNSLHQLGQVRLAILRDTPVNFDQQHFLLIPTSPKRLPLATIKSLTSNESVAVLLQEALLASSQPWVLDHLFAIAPTSTIAIDLYPTHFQPGIRLISQ